jgi:hypothetical protein
MGYDLHITRAPLWEENDETQIPFTEWLALVQEDPELKPEPGYGPYAVRWQTTSQEGGWFDWSDGNVFTTDPNRATVRKMLSLATLLAGTVQGDEGEVYRTETDWRGED